MDRRPIGFMDSGMGGISVLGHAIRLFPNENFLYFGDTANAPYGEKKPDEVLELTRAGVRTLLNGGCKAIVIACNTATSAAAESLRAELKEPIIGIEPALKPAALLPGSGKIAVLATTMTLNLPKFLRLKESYAPDAILLPCPGLMECVEKRVLKGPEVDELLDRLLLPVQNVKLKAAVLGCTHYPFLKASISSHLPGVPLFDGGEGTAKQLGRRLAEEDLISDGPGGRVEFLSSDPDPKIRTVMRSMLELWSAENDADSQEALL